MICCIKTLKDCINREYIVISTSSFMWLIIQAKYIFKQISNIPIWATLGLIIAPRSSL